MAPHNNGKHAEPIKPKQIAKRVPMQTGVEGAVLEPAVPSTMEAVTERPGQAHRLADQRLPLLQRQALAGEIGRRHGNGHLQQVMAAVSDRNHRNATGRNWATTHTLRLVQLAEEMEGDEPTEAERAAALAAAANAEQNAARAAGEGQNQTAAAADERRNQQQAQQQAADQVEAQTAQPAPAPAAAGTATPAQAPEQAVVGEAAPDAGMDDGAVEAPAEGDLTVAAPASPEEDPAFQAVAARTKRAAAREKDHDLATHKAGEAQAAVESPASERESQAQANQVGKMAKAETPGFDAAALKAQLMSRIAELSPKTVKEADEFKDQNKLGGVKEEMQGKVAQERDAARTPLQQETQAAPDTGSVPPKPVSPLAPAAPEAPPPDVAARQAAPKVKTPGQVEQPLQEHTQQLDARMAEADVTEEQLANANEPSFEGALDAKREAKTQAATAPTEYRQFEQEQIAGAETEAATVAQERMQAMRGERTGVVAQVEGQQGQAKSKDEQARAQVAAKIQGIYNRTKTNVEKTLDGLDAEVGRVFDRGAAAAKQVFEEFVDAKMTAYKEKRYGGWFGWAKWAKDKLLGMPSEVNAFYSDGRQRYLKEMDAVIDTVVTLIGSGLAKAKAEIAAGKQEIQEYVASLPQELQGVGRQAAQDIQGKFDALEQSVDAKQDELINTLAQKYQENLKAVDARIEELKAANQGLVQKALNAVIGVIQTIIRLTKMLLKVLAKVASVVGRIIKHPIEFLGNLISGLKQGFQNFADNIGTHLKAGFIAWLTGAMGGVGLQLPDDVFSLEGIFSLVTQLLGITWDYIRAKAVKLLGEPVVHVLETAFEPFKILITEGPMGLWAYVKEQFADLKAMVMDQIEDLLITQVIKAGIKWLVGLFNPVGAFIKAAMAIYEIVMFFVNKGSQIMELVDSIIDAVGAIAGGAIGGAAKLIENALAKALPLAIGFLASLLGIGGLAKKVQAIIQKVRGKVDAAIEKFILKVKKIGQKLLARLGVGGKDAAGKGEAKSTPEEQQQGVAAIEREERQYVQDGSVSHENAVKTAAAVKQKHPVFQSVTVVDGGDSWDYQYVFRTGGKKDTPATKAKEDRVNISLRRPKGFRKSTRDALKEIFPDDHQLKVKSRALVRLGLARRHIVPAQEFLDHYLDVLNGRSLASAARLLRSKGIDVGPSPTNAIIQAGAQKLLRDAVNDPENLWIGDSRENSALQDMYYDSPEDWSPQKLEGHYRRMKNKWFLKK